MNYKNSEAYDDDDFFEKYLAKRNRKISPNNILEKPIIDELIIDVTGKSILELGCGSGDYGKELLEKGADYYHGIDGSLNMIDSATELLRPFENCTLEKTKVQSFDFKRRNYDLVVSRLMLHYLDSLESIFAQVYSSLEKDGEFIFSAEHPVITSCYDAYNTGNKRQWIVDDYFNEGQRINKWIDKNVVKFHRPLESYFQLAKNNNFEILAIRESKPIKTMFADQDDYLRRMKIPLFIFFKLKKGRE